MQRPHARRPQGSFRRSHANRPSKKDEADRQEEARKLGMQPHLIVHIEHLKTIEVDFCFDGLLIILR